MAVDDQAVGGGFLGNLPPNVRIAVLAGGALLLLILIYFAFFKGSSEEVDDGFTTVYRNLPLADAGNAKDFLEQEYSIPVKLAENGTALRVPKDKAEDALVKMAQKNMPGSEVVGYEIFDKQSFISTDFEKKVALQRAMNGTLSRLVRRFEGVEDARVNVVVPEPALFSEERLPTTASVLLEFSGGGGFKPEYVTAITHLIASAVPGLKPGNVTIVDNAGTVLHEGQEGLFGEDSAKKYNQQLQEQIRLKRMMEQQLENKVILMLEKVLGPGKVKATVTADVLFDKTQVRERKHDPVLIDDGQGNKIQTTVATRSQVEKNESTGTGGASGQAGGTVANDATAQATDSQEAVTSGGATEKTTSERTNTQQSYNYNNIEALIAKESGTIQAKAISVQYELPAVVGDEAAAAEEGLGGPPPLDDAAVMDMVKKAVNFKEDVDQINVRQVKFDTSRYDMLKEQMESAKESFNWWYIVIGLICAVVGFGVGGALMSKKKAAAGADAFGAGGMGAPQYAAIPGAPMPGMPGAPPGAMPGAPGLPPGAPGAPMPAQQAQEVTRAPIMPPTPDNPFGFLQGVTPQTVAQLLSTERLPTLVAVLAQLDPSQAEDVINLLNPEIQNEVRTRLAQNPVLPPMTQKMVSQSLKKRLAAMSGSSV